jgi:DNA-binding LytR/AlgR family response regulator
MSPRALIADDEKRLAEHLADRLSVLWPDLAICGFATSGTDALAMINQEKPDIVFLDIQMPGMSGIEVVKRMTHPALVVFVTAFDKYAVESFDEEAVDYVLKPVSDKRLERTIVRIKKRLEGAEQMPGLDSVLKKLNFIIERKDPYVSFLRAASGKEIRLISVDTILFIESRSKYTAVVTRDGEFLMRTPINALLKQLNPEKFWQIHRSTIVNIAKVQSVKKVQQQRYVLRLVDSSEVLTVSRQFAHLFNQI